MTSSGRAWIGGQSRRAERSDRVNYSIGISVPTNADVHAVGLEVRQRMWAEGLLGGKDWAIRRDGSEW